MLERIVRPCLRSVRFREIAARLLAEEIRANVIAAKRAERAERRERRRTRPFCKDCARFGEDCGSTNLKGWCKRFEAR